MTHQNVSVLPKSDLMVGFPLTGGGTQLCKASCDCSTENCRLMLLANPGLKSTGWNVCDIKTDFHCPSNHHHHHYNSHSLSKCYGDNDYKWTRYFLFSISFFYLYLLPLSSATYFITSNHRQTGVYGV